MPVHNPLASFAEKSGQKKKPLSFSGFPFLKREGVDKEEIRMYYKKGFINGMILYTTD